MLLQPFEGQQGRPNSQRPFSAPLLFLLVTPPPLIPPLKLFLLLKYLLFLVWAHRAALPHSRFPSLSSLPGPRWGHPCWWLHSGLQRDPLLAPACSSVLSAGTLLTPPAGLPQAPGSAYPEPTEYQKSVRNPSLPLPSTPSPPRAFWPPTPSPPNPTVSTWETWESSWLPLRPSSCLILLHIPLIPTQECLHTNLLSIVGTWGPACFSACMVPWAASSFCSLHSCWWYFFEDKPRHHSSLTPSCLKVGVPNHILHATHSLVPTWEPSFFCLFLPILTWTRLSPVLSLTLAWKALLFSLCLGKTPPHSSRDNSNDIFVKPPPTPLSRLSHSLPL